MKLQDVFEQLLNATGLGTQKQQQLTAAAAAAASSTATV